MADTYEFDLNNLELDDNQFETLPDGDYHFAVESHEIDYYSGSSDKIPQGTQQIICTLTVPYMGGGEVRTASVKNTLNVYKKAMFAIRQFAECIGMMPEKGKAKFDIDVIDGMTGVCSLTTFEGKNGTWNRVGTFYPPSKVPAVTANDDAWEARQENDGFLTVGEDDVPFN